MPSSGNPTWNSGDVITAAKLNTIETALTNSLDDRGDTLTGDLTVRRDQAVTLLVQRNTTDAGGPSLTHQKSRGTNAAPTIVAASDELGSLTWRGWDGAAYQPAAQIRALVDGTPGAGDMPGKLSLLTSADGGVTLTERLSISQAGAVTVPGTLGIGAAPVADLHVQIARAGGDADARIGNTSTAASANGARLLMAADGANNTGDVFTRLVSKNGGAGETNVVYGLDTSDSGRFKLEYATTLGSNTSYLRYDSDGSLRVYIGNVAQLQVVNGQILVPDGSVSAPGVAFAADTNTGFYQSVADEVRVAAGGVNRMTIGAIITIPDTRLSIDRISENPLYVNRRTTDGDVISIAQDGTTEGTISVSGTTVSYNAFAGGHPTQLQAGQAEPPVGAVVVALPIMIPSESALYVEERLVDEVKADGTVWTRLEQTRHPRRLDATWRAEPRPAKANVPYVAGTTTPNDPRAYGAWLGKQADDTYGMSVGVNDQPLYTVIGLGLYQVRVTDTGGAIRAGDYLTTSARRYEAQRQADDLLHSYTVAKALVDVDWSGVPVDPVLGYRWRLIPATIHAS